jgi:hypothetical protein
MATCPCQEAAIGAFMLGGLGYLAADSREFFGGDFLPVFSGFIISPFDSHPVLKGWAVFVIIGLWLLVRGIRQNIRDRDSAPVFWSLVAILAAAVGIDHNRGDHAIVEAFYWGIIAACIANLGMAYGAYVRSPARRQKRFDQLHAEHQRVVEENARQRQVILQMEEVRDVLIFPGVRAALLHALHSDHHAGSGLAEIRQRDDVMVKLTAIYQRIGGDGR